MSLQPGIYPRKRAGRDAAQLASFDQLSDSAHVRRRIVAGWLDVSLATLYRWEAKGLITARVKIGGATLYNVGLLRADVARARA